MPLFIYLQSSSDAYAYQSYVPVLSGLLWTTLHTNFLFPFPPPLAYPSRNLHSFLLLLPLALLAFISHKSPIPVEQAPSLSNALGGWGIDGKNLRLAGRVGEVLFGPRYRPGLGQGLRDTNHAHAALHRGCRYSRRPVDVESGILPP